MERAEAPDSCSTAFLRLFQGPYPGTTTRMRLFLSGPMNAGLHHGGEPSQRPPRGKPKPEARRAGIPQPRAQPWEGAGRWPAACRGTSFGPFRAHNFIGGEVPKAWAWAEGGGAGGAGGRLGAVWGLFGGCFLGGNRLSGLWGVCSVVRNMCRRSADTCFSQNSICPHG